VSTFLAWLMPMLGIAAAIIFYGRFYIQWIVSEIRKESVIPVVFWYMSAVGSVMLLVHASYIRSPVGVLSHSFNIVIYARNLVHIWREKETLSRRRNIAVHGLIGLVVSMSLVLLAVTWLREYEAVSGEETSVQVRNWIWIGVGVVGQGLFACRFLIQWIASERARKSVVPVVFWYISLAASVLLAASHFQRAEWIFAIGVGSTSFIYLRNLWLIHRHKPAPLPKN